MAYGILVQVKQNYLHIDPLNTDVDDDIQTMIVKSDDYINSKLRVFSVSTPLAYPDDQIIRMSNSLAAAWYIYYNSPTHPMQGVYDAKKEIDEYLQAQYGKQTGDMGTSLLSKVNGTILGTESGSGNL